MSVKAKVHARIKKAPDFELHVRTLRIEDVEVVELRDYVPSEKWYGRGVYFEPGQFPQILEALQSLASYLGGSAAPAQTAAAAKLAGTSKSQGKLF